MLFLETTKGFVPWTGQKIDGMSHPRNIETVWTAEQLAEKRLYKPIRPPVPEGKVVVGETVGRENGAVTVIYQLEDVPPPDPPVPSVREELAAIKLRLDALEAKVAVRA